MEIVFDASGRDPSGYAFCSSCGYPYKTPACDNPACEANPSIPDEVKARRRDAQAAIDAQRKEHERWRQYKSRAMEASRK